MIFYLFIVSMRMINWVNQLFIQASDVKGYFDICIIISVFAVWQALYYLVYEIEKVQLKLQSSNLAEYQKKYKLLSIRRFFFFAIITICLTVQSLIQSLRVLQTFTLSDAQLPFVAYTVAVSVKMILDTFTSAKVGRVMLYFIRKRKEKNPVLTRCNKFIIFWIFFLITLNLLHSLLNGFFGITILLKNDWSTLYFNLFYIHKYMQVPATDFLTGSTLLYLFYSQSRRENSN